MPSLNMPVHRLKVAILPLDLPCPGPVTHSGEILTTGKSHGKKAEKMYKILKQISKGVKETARMQGNRGKSIPSIL